MFSQAFLPAAARTVHRNAANAPTTCERVDKKRSEGIFIEQCGEKRRN